MEVTPGRWLKLTSECIKALPNESGVFEVANLVRTVVYIGSGDGRLRDRIEAFGPVPSGLPPAVGGHYFRYELTDNEDETIRRRLKGYRREHGGSLPVGNMRAEHPDTERKHAA